MVAGGDLEREMMDLFSPESDFVISADAGAERLLEWGIVPDLAVGDFDTARPEVMRELNRHGVKLEPLPTAKNETDLHYALARAVQHDPDEIVILGALGGARFDHMLANIGLLEWLAGQGISAVMHHRHNRMRLLQGPGTIRFQKSHFTYVSLIPVTREVNGIVTDGLKYPLRSETLYRGLTRGISNEMESEEAVVTIEWGKLLIVESKDH